MSEVAHLLDQVYSAGGRLSVIGGRLRVTAPKPLPVDLMEVLRAHKPAILAELGQAGGDSLYRQYSDYRLH